jgi:hypothetical protein
MISAEIQCKKFLSALSQKQYPNRECPLGSKVL